MSSFNIHHKSRLCAEEAFDRVCQVIEDDEQLRDIDPSYRCEFDADELSGRANSRLFKAQLEVWDEDAGSLVELFVELPMKYALFKNAIAKALKNKMRAEL